MLAFDFYRVSQLWNFLSSQIDLLRLPWRCVSQLADVCACALSFLNPETSPLHSLPPYDVSILCQSKIGEDNSELPSLPS